METGCTYCFNLDYKPGRSVDQSGCTPPICVVINDVIFPLSSQALSKNGKVFGNGIMVGVQPCIDKV